MSWIRYTGCPNCGCGRECTNFFHTLAYRPRYRMTITNRTCPAFWNGYSVVLFDNGTAASWLPEPFPAPPIACGGTFEISFRGPNDVLQLYPFMSGRNGACVFKGGGFLPGDPNIFGIYCACVDRGYQPTCDGASWDWDQNVTMVSDPPFLQMRNIPICFNCDANCQQIPEQTCFIDVTITEHIP